VITDKCRYVIFLKDY